MSCILQVDGIHRDGQINDALMMMMSCPWNNAKLSVAVSEDTELSAIVGIMEKRRIKRVPVVRGRKVVGMVTRADLLRGFARVIPGGAAAEAPKSDLELRNRIVAEIDRLPWAARNAISVTVKNGEVDLQGAIFNVKERDALRVAAENVPGVKAVRDHLVWVEPTSGMTLDVSAP